MKIQSKGMGVRYETASALIQKSADTAPGLGLYKRFDKCFCFSCQQDKPRKGSKKVLGGQRCADCVALRAKKEGGAA